MIATKRHREGSITTTPTLSISNGSRTSSVARSSPIRQSGQGRYPQQHPSKRVSPYPPSSRLSSEAPSTQPHTVHGPSGLRYNGPSNADVHPEDNADVDNREENDSLNEVIMAVDLKERGTVGCCYYVAREEKVIVHLPSADEASDWLGALRS